ncbi:MAG: hypothetical protein HYX20_02510 [Candidatus Yanofskybacteria bacterium]|nr:hypothetical protein [Candidatus Yanofskybacteria bacterium]
MKKIPKKSRFFELGEKPDEPLILEDPYMYPGGSMDCYTAPFLSEIQTPYGLCWVLKVSKHSRRRSILLVRAKNKSEALSETAKFFRKKRVEFYTKILNNKDAARGQICIFPDDLRLSLA